MIKVASVISIIAHKWKKPTDNVSVNSLHWRSVWLQVMCSFNTCVHTLWALRQWSQTHFQQRRQKMAFRLSDFRSNASTVWVAGVYFKRLLGGGLLFTKWERKEGLNTNLPFFSSAVNYFTETNDSFYFPWEFLCSLGTWICNSLISKVFSWYFFFRFSQPNTAFIYSRF